MDALTQQPADLLMLDLGLGDDFALGALPRCAGLRRRPHPGADLDARGPVRRALPARRGRRFRRQVGAVGHLAGRRADGAGRADLGQPRAARHAAAPCHRPRRRWSDRPELSVRELEVLRLVAAGRSTREIADQLNRSVKTIETHKQSLKSKLDADSPAMLVRKAIAFLGEGGDACGRRCRRAVPGCRRGGSPGARDAVAPARHRTR
jgi:DNA-binding CsgD family transcriptional regulator